MMLVILLLVTLAAAAPPKKLVITENFFPDCHLMYTSNHDIVDISVPLNQLNYGNDVEEKDTEHLNNVFFVEADIKENGDKDFKGLYVFKHGKAKKLLDNGQSVTFAERYTAYFGAKDGIYKYNVINVTAEKIGDVTDSVIKMAVHLKDADIYYLTEDYVLYKFANDEVKAAKVDAVKDARDIVFDYHGNLIFYDGTKQLYIYNGNTVEKIKGIKSNPNKIDLVKPAMLVEEVYVVVDGKAYKINKDGTSEKSVIEFEVTPTAFAPDAYFWQYYAYNKKIYEYNVASRNEDCRIAELDEFRNGKQVDVSRIKTARKPFDNL